VSIEISFSVLSNIHFTVKKIQHLFLSVFFVFVLSESFAQRTVTSLNNSWRFILDDKDSFAKRNYVDDEWRILDIPHDWAFENGISKDGAQGQGGGYHSGGIAWYRKTIEIVPESLSKTVYLEFDGVYMNSTVWVNGQLAGKRPYGYISFRYDISEYLKPGKNSIAVRVDNSLEPSARWYHPCGIYAPVRLIEMNPLHIVPNSIFITTKDITEEISTVNVELKLSSTSSKDNLQIKSSIFYSKW
jgi:beta-galactosidase